MEHRPSIPDYANLRGIADITVRMFGPRQKENTISGAAELSAKARKCGFRGAAEIVAAEEVAA